MKRLKYYGKRLKYYGLMLFAASPIIIAIVLFIFVWFIKIPYSSSYYYYSSDVRCSECDKPLGSQDEYCSICGKAVKDVGVVKQYSYCAECRTVYRNADSDYCKECGNALEPEGYVRLSSLGFSTCREFNRARMKDNLFRLLDNEIIITLFVIPAALIIRNIIIEQIRRWAMKKIIMSDSSYQDRR